MQLPTTKWCGMSGGYLQCRQEANAQHYAPAHMSTLVTQSLDCPGLELIKKPFNDQLLGYNFASISGMMALAKHNT